MVSSDMKTKLIFSTLSIVLLSLPTPAHARPVRCMGEIATIVGTRHAEMLTGTAGRDVIAGRGGRDSIVGRGGNDLICGNGGDDRIVGGTGHDKISGGPQSDRFMGGPGNDVLDGGSDADPDKEWNDVLTYRGSRQGVLVDSSAGTAEGQGSDELVGYFEILEGSPFDDVLDGGFEYEIRGLGGNDHLITGAVHGDLKGGPGDDVLEASAFTTTYGSAAVDYGGAGQGVQVDLAAGTATGQGNDTLIGINHLMGSGHDDVLLGDDARNILSGGGGNDLLDGRGGDDSLLAEEGNDVVHGGAGEDSIVDPALAGPSSGDDEYHGGDGADRFIISEGADSYDGGADTDVLRFYPAEGLTIDLLTGTVTMPGDPDDLIVNIEDVSGSGFEGAGSVTLIGDDGPNRLFGGVGDDTISGGGGDDALRGEGGNDQIDGGAGSDRANGGRGTDSCVNAEHVDSCES